MPGRPHGSRQLPTAARGARAHAREAPARSPVIFLERLVIVATVILSVWAVATLWTQAAHGTFATDECFHATAAEVIRRTGSLPATFPQFYSGFYYYYQPLFHVVAAVWMSLFGPQALHVLPTVLFAGLLATLLARPLGSGSVAAGTWAALITLTNQTLLSYATRFYAEGLVTLLAVLSLACFAAVLRRPAIARATTLGITTGAAMLTKFNAWVLLG